MFAIMYTTPDGAEIIEAADAIEAADLVAIIHADGGEAIIMPLVDVVTVTA